MMVIMKTMVGIMVNIWGDSGQWMTGGTMTMIGTGEGIIIGGDTMTMTEAGGEMMMIDGAEEEGRMVIHGDAGVMRKTKRRKTEITLLGRPLGIY